MPIYNTYTLGTIREDISLLKLIYENYRIINRIILNISDGELCICL